MFRIGQKVVCISDGKWDENDLDKSIGYGPSKDEIVTISRISDGYLIFVEYPEDANAIYAYDPVEFRPLITAEDEGTMTIEAVLTEVEKFYLPA